MNCRATQISTAVFPADPLRSQQYIQAPQHWHSPPRFSSGLWGMLALAGTVTFWGVRLKVQALNISCFFRGTFHIKLLITLQICVAHQEVCVYVSPHFMSEHGAAQQTPPRGMFHQRGCLLCLSGPAKGVLLTC